MDIIGTIDDDEDVENMSEESETEIEVKYLEEFVMFSSR